MFMKGWDDENCYASISQKRINRKKYIVNYLWKGLCINNVEMCV